MCKHEDNSQSIDSVLRLSGVKSFVDQNLKDINGICEPSTDLEDNSISQGE